MQISTSQQSLLPSTSAWHRPPAFPPLDQVSRPTISTAEAAYYLGLRPQTMRAHASKQDFPILPFKIQNRLHWRVSDIRALLSGGTK